jgi:hypothetical protein
MDDNNVDDAKGWEGRVREGRVREEDGTGG